MKADVALNAKKKEKIIKKPDPVGNILFHFRIFFSLPPHGLQHRQIGWFGDIIAVVIEKQKKNTN